MALKMKIIFYFNQDHILKSSEISFYLLPTYIISVLLSMARAIFRQGDNI